jgi:N-acetylglucosamine kinase-like BadF-type ATPase
MPSIFSVGVDRGGTWIRLEAVDRVGKPLRSLKSPSLTLQQLPSFLRRRLRTWKATPQYLSVGSRGVWKPTDRKRLKLALRGLAPDITVLSDVEAAWHAAFKSGPGIVVIAGTGSIAYGRNARDRSARAGGLGPQRGDEGSAYWIGKEWLERVRAPHSPLAVRRVAALAPQVWRRAQSGDARAQKVIHEAQHHLANLAIAAAHRLKMGGTVRLSWGGSLLDHHGFRAGFRRALDRRFRLQSPRRAPAMALALLWKS